MTPTEFNASVAEVMSVERTEIATVDRSLAKHGLRQLARGRYRPDISLREGVQFICAWAAAKSLTLAADDVQRLEEVGQRLKDAVSNKPFVPRKLPLATTGDVTASAVPGPHNDPLAAPNETTLGCVQD